MHTVCEGFPAVYAPVVNLVEQMMLEMIDQKSEGECEETAGEGAFECVCHYLGRPAYYHNQKTFEEWMTEQPGSGNTAASRMARAHLTWGNYGKWAKDRVPSKPFDSSHHFTTVNTRYMYTIFFN
jgi:hypothetical protein